MQSGTTGGLPWWLWVAIVACCVVAVVVGRRRRASKHAQSAETMAQEADASHESAVTRHEGGA